MRARVLAILGLAHAVSALAATSVEPTKEQTEFFEKKVLPILSENCYKCHSQEQGKSKGGLTLDTHAGLMKGGEDGVVVTPGDPAKSPLVTAIKYLDPDLEMPPKGEKLKDEQIETLIAWVKMGAVHTKRDAKLSKLTGLNDKARHHWAFQRIVKPPIPVTRNKAWCRTPVDAFIVQKLEEKGLQAGGDPGVGDSRGAELIKRGVLIRRATYDLIGLPPTIAELDAFVLDKAPTPTAFARVIERLLASPHYGERWGRFWLDTARYADTIGGDRGDRNRDYRYPYAWTYRDYVIKSFNDDKPYDRFIVEQLAADKLPDIDKDPKRLAALGFLTVGQRFDNANDVINDRIDVVSKGFLGLTVVCARCHDHKFDPIPTKDYYALHGIFASTMEPTDEPMINSPPPELLKDFETKLAALEGENRRLFYQVVAEKNAQFRQKPAAFLLAAYKDRSGSSEKAQLRREEIIKTEKIDPVLLNYTAGRLRGDDPVWGPWRRFTDIPDGDYDFLGSRICEEVAANKGGRYNAIVASYFAGQKPKSIEDIAAIYGAVFAKVDRQGNDFLATLAAITGEVVPGFDKATQQLLSFPLDAEVASKMTSERVRSLSNGWPNQFRGGAKFKFAAINELKLTHGGAPARAMAVADKPHPSNTAVMIRGQTETRGEVVPHRFLEILSGPKATPFPNNTSGRLELADAIASKSNPLTARVIVNRVWMHHFGEGFVRTLDDLGTQSEAPSHPELLDYLATYLEDRNWSLKDLHRLIMNSHVYQISSDTKDTAAAIDPDNRLLWRANVRRLDFESMRDSLLVFSGKIDRGVKRDIVGGKTVETLTGGQPVNLTDEPFSYRRSVYGYIDRGNLPDLMAHFDFSMPDMPNSRRTSTTVPQQALYLMNSPMAIDVARSVIARPEIAGAPGNLNRIITIYRVLFQRQPKPEEIALAYDFLSVDAKNQPSITDEQKKINEKLAKKAEDTAGDMMMMNRNDGYKAIQNTGQFVERKPLTQWETYAQALLLSNEAAYVN